MRSRNPYLKALASPGALRFSAAFAAACGAGAALACLAGLTQLTVPSPPPPRLPAPIPAVTCQPHRPTEQAPARGTKLPPQLPALL